MAFAGSSKTQGLNSHKDRAQMHRKSSPKGSGNIQIHFTDVLKLSGGNERLKIINVLKFSRGKMRLRDCILTFVIFKNSDFIFFPSLYEIILLTLHMGTRI